MARSTLCGWVADVAAALAPIGDQLRREILATEYLQTDDTPVTILQDRGGPLKGRLWTYLDPIGRQVVFDATATHAREGPAAVLAPFTGWLQADAYAGYDALYRTGRIVEVGCWAHARRRFVEALETDPSAALIVALVQRLYQVEREAADTTPDERQARRQAQSLPILAQIDEARQRLAATTLPKAPLGDALRYLGNQWGALQRYVEDGRLQIDNNNAERELRAVGIGRKNWLFAGSMAGAERAAPLYSLIQSCRLRGVPPFLYLRDVLLRVATHPLAQIAQLTPRGWAETFGLGLIRSRGHVAEGGYDVPYGPRDPAAPAPATTSMPRRLAWSSTRGRASGRWPATSTSPARRPRRRLSAHARRDTEVDVRVRALFTRTREWSEACGFTTTCARPAYWSVASASRSDAPGGAAGPAAQRYRATTITLETVAHLATGKQIRTTDN